MPDITLPNVYVDGNTPTAAGVNANIHRPRSVPDNFSVLNGQVSEENLDFTRLSKGVVVPGSFTSSKTVGGTANLDYFDDWFGGYSGSSPSLSRYVAIPGLATTFYVPWDTEDPKLGAASGIYLFWHFSCIIENGVVESGQSTALPSGNTRFNLFVDGERTEIYALFIRGFNSIVRRDNLDDTPFNDSRVPDTRQWSSGIVIDGVAGGYQPLSGKGIPLFCSKGWHSASIRLASPANHVRVKTRHFGVRIYR